MDLNIQLPEWLTKEKIQNYRSYLEKAIPYTENEVAKLPFDGERDWDRYMSYSVKKDFNKIRLTLIARLVKAVLLYLKLNKSALCRNARCCFLPKNSDDVKSLRNNLTR